ncbi:MAG: hypothetical protein LBP81_03470 [Treponema sp.]|nr:hypothetical protein [Treponema sp.]
MRMYPLLSEPALTSPSERSGPFTRSLRRPAGSGLKTLRDINLHRLS